MCRLLGAIAASPAPLPELLNGDLEPFVQLAAEHSDGWGISFIDAADRVVTAKEPVSALRSWTFRPLVERIVTSAVILHLRISSPGSPNVLENTHPFATAEHAFAHNGQFRPVDILDKTLGVSVTEAQGDTDSERYYLAVRDRILVGEAPGDAITAAAASVRTCAVTWESTNCLLLTLAGVCAYADHSANPETFTRRDRDFFDLRYRTEPDRVVVASTGWSGPGASWTRLPNRQVLVIGRDLALTVNDEFAPTGDSD